MEFNADIEFQMFLDDNRVYPKDDKKIAPNQKFLATNSFFYEMSDDVPHYFDVPLGNYKGWGYISNLLFEFVEFNFETLQWLCQVVDYYE